MKEIADPVDTHELCQITHSKSGKLSPDFKALCYRKRGDVGSTSAHCKIDFLFPVDPNRCNPFCLAVK
jgi:hypothetical protein